MKKIFLISALFTLINAVAFGQVYKGEVLFSKIPAPAMHYLQEYTFDTTLNPAAWRAEQKTLHVSFASTDELYFRSEVPVLEKKTTSWECIGWKGERVNAEILVWSPDTLQQVRVAVSDLRSAAGRSLSKKNIRPSMVNYVISNYPYGAKDVTCGASPYPNLYLMPDRFTPLVSGTDRFSLPGKTVRPIWLSIDIPVETVAGEYRGTVEVRSETFAVTLNVTVTVQNQLLPKPHEWKHRLDLWQNPWVVAWENQLTPWSPEHKLLLKKHLQLYADAGGKYITTYSVHSPWSDNSYNIEGGMIEWTKEKSGAWRFGYKIFDEYVQLAMSVGIDKAITIYTPVPWGFRFRYINAVTGNYEYVSWPPDSKEFEAFWNIFLSDLKKHLQQKGWFEKTYLGINENAMDQTLAAIKVINKHSKEWKITYAGDWHKELEDLLDDYCFLYGKESDVDVVKRRSSKGFTTAYYVCCNPPVPNNFVFSPPVEGRWMGWYTQAHGYDGFLRWAYDAWPADPMRDARHELWPAGDCFLVYPGGNSCIRFEKMREGIVDFEKIRILKAKAAASNNKDVRSLMKELDKHLETLLVEKDFETNKIIKDVIKGKMLVDELSEKLTPTVVSKK